MHGTAEAPFAGRPAAVQLQHVPADHEPSNHQGAARPAGDAVELAKLELLPSPVAEASPTPSPASVPDWAVPLTPEQLVRFEELVRKRLQGQKVTFHFGEGYVEAEAGQLGLSNVAQRCAQADPSAWGAIVDEHFDRTLAAFESSDEVAGKLKDWNWAAPRLRLRLYPPDTLPEDAKRISGADLPEVETVLLMPPSARACTRPPRCSCWTGIRRCWGSTAPS